MNCPFYKVKYLKGNRVKYLTDIELKSKNPNLIKESMPCPGKLRMLLKPELDGYDEYDTSAILEIEWRCTENHPSVGFIYNIYELQNWIDEQLNKDTRTLSFKEGKGWGLE